MSDYKYIDVINGFLTLKQEEMVVNIFQNSRGQVFVYENCEYHFRAEYSKDDAISMFEEIISAIKNGDLS